LAEQMLLKEYKQIFNQKKEEEEEKRKKFE